MRVKNFIPAIIAMILLTGCSLDDLDECPNNPRKTQKGICGCDLSDIDSDGDTIPNCVDKLPNLNDNVDTDGDRIINIEDPCPLDAANNCCTNGIDGKESPGFCGCDVKETDSDDDTLPDCVDVCKNDVNKTIIKEGETLYAVTVVDGAINTKTETTNTCGCGTPDTDSDGDTVPDCIDICQNNPAKKTEADKGQCKCEDEIDINKDTDRDGTPDCIDACVDNDQIQTTEQRDSNPCGCDKECVPCPSGSLLDVKGICGCNIQPITGGNNKNTEDTDDDGVLDCLDICPYNPLISDVRTGDSAIDAPIEDRCVYGDADGDGLLDDEDSCPTNPDRTATATTCNVYNTSTHEIVIRRALDWNTMKTVLDADTEHSAWTVKIENDIDFGYNYLDLNNISGYQLKITYDAKGIPKKCHVEMPEINLHNVHVIGNHHTITATHKVRYYDAQLNKVEEASLRCEINNPIFSSIHASEVGNLTLDLDLNGAGCGLLANAAKNNSTIHDIVVKGSVNSADTTYVGGMIGLVMGDSLTSEQVKTHIDVYDCHADGIRVEALKSVGAGGLVGGIANAIIRLPQATNKVTFVNGTTSVGGLFGMIQSLDTYTNHDSKILPPTQGKISTQIGTVKGTTKVGGMIGEYLCGSQGCISDLYNISHNVEQVNCSGDFAGGFIGFLNSHNGSVSYISNHAGSVESQGENVGGFAGNLTISNLSEISAVSNIVTGTIVGNKRVGGFIGSLSAGTKTDDALDAPLLKKIQSKVASVEAKSNWVGGFLGTLNVNYNLMTGFKLHNVSSFANVILQEPVESLPGYIPYRGGLIGTIEDGSTNPAPKWTINIYNVVTAAAIFNRAPASGTLSQTNSYLTTQSWSYGCSQGNSTSTSVQTFYAFSFGSENEEYTFENRGPTPKPFTENGDGSTNDTASLIPILNAASYSNIGWDKSGVTWVSDKFRFIGKSADTSLPALQINGL